MKIAIAAALTGAAYLLGSIPFALILGRLRGVDIRRTGSGNIGATNLSRALGRRWGIAAFALDFRKGLIPVVAAGLLGSPGPIPGEIHPLHAQIACALAAVLGHVFPVWLGFRGGKGVATTFGALSGLVWPAALIAGAVWLVLFLATRTVSIASLGAAAAFPIATVIVFRDQPADLAWPADILAVLVAAIIIVRHRSNIHRLLTGQEGRLR
jgi:acyl phosphate:glycerol-3-phosphate acyltransferase